jgi:hypothetical protein
LLKLLHSIRFVASIKREGIVFFALHQKWRIVALLDRHSTEQQEFSVARMVVVPMASVLAGLLTTTSTNPLAVLLPVAPPEDLPQLSSCFQTPPFFFVTVSLF